MITWLKARPVYVAGEWRMTIVKVGAVVSQVRLIIVGFKKTEMDINSK